MTTLARQQHTEHLTLQPDHAQRLANLCGRLNEHIHLIESFLTLKIRQRGNEFQLTGEPGATVAGGTVLRSLYGATANGGSLTPALVHLALQELADDDDKLPQPPAQVTLLRTPKLSVKPRGANQRRYVAGILRHDLSFGIGPAGTGKTFLAVACAVQALEANQVNRLILARPAVEAGEKLGYLPGDLSQKVNPYLRPLYDALYEMLGVERVGRLIERQVIEVAPLAYMRGRTLNNAFIILDEGQNATGAQMKMFLTRIGFGSTAVVTGDITQIDLASGEQSGLIHAAKVLADIDEINFTWFRSKDVVRHRLVQRIVEAYDRQDKRRAALQPVARQADGGGGGGGGDPDG